MVLGATTFFKGFAGAFAGVAAAAFINPSFAEAKAKDDTMDDFTAFMNSTSGSANKGSSTSVCNEKTWGVPWISDWDNPTQRGIKPRSSRIKRQILLIRHGQYQNEKSKVDDSARTLTALGERQARATGEYLRKLFDEKSAFIEPGIVEPKNFYVSNMTRAKQTSNIILEAMYPGNNAKLIGKKTAKEDPILRERFPCDTEPPSRHKATHRDMIDAEEAFTRYFHRPISDEPTCDIIVCHANVIRYFICRSLQIPPEAWLRFSLPHASITSIVVGGGGNVKVSTIGSAFHMPVSDVTTSNLP